MVPDRNMTVVVASLASISPCLVVTYVLITVLSARVLISPAKMSKNKESQHSHKTPLWLGKISSVIQDARAELVIFQNTDWGSGAEASSSVL